MKTIPQTPCMQEGGRRTTEKKNKRGSKIIKNQA